MILDQGGVTVAQSAMGGNVTLDAIAYDSTGAIQLAGRGEPGDKVQIYVDGQTCR